MVVTVKHYKNFGSFIKKNSPSNIISTAKSQQASHDVFVTAVSAFNKQHSKHSQADKLPILKTLPGPNDEAKERFCFLLILQQMASSEDSENEYLSHLYECLAAAVDDNNTFSLFTLRSLVLKRISENVTEVLRRRPEQVRVQTYGSYAEDLHVGIMPDIDVMIFPTADELTINDELIEYCFPSNPLHVRIRGTGHPLLQSCLLENTEPGDTEYVATSALKNFHPAIFGRIGSVSNPDDVAMAPGLFFGFTSVKNSMTSPAVKYTIDLPSLLRKLLKQSGGEEESVLDSTCLPSEDGTEHFFECLVSSSSDAKLVIEHIPAFRCLTWPMVAQEWGKRQRKWPSCDVVHKVIREGFHLVVKAPKNGGNPECDFRISFSHAEYLLSQEINEIQRECYRCLKTYHRVYLSTEAKGLISFHLKNIFLRTIEETGGEMWIESRRAECMSKLFANLLKALRERHLPHYFVQSYNLFDIDYIQDPAILESLTERVEQIMKNPVKLAKELFLVVTRLQGIKHSSPVREQEQEQMNSPSNQLQSQLMLFSSLRTARKVCLGITKDLIEAVNNSDCILENLDPMERTVIEDLREIQKKCPSVVCFNSLNPDVTSFGGFAFMIERNFNDINWRHYVLTFLKQVTETLKYVMPLYEAGKGGKLEDVLRHVLNPAPENPFIWNLLCLGLEEDEKEIIRTGLNHFLEAWFGDANNNEDDIPLD